MRRQLVWMVLRLADKVLLLGLRRGREGVAGAMGRSGALTNTVECRLLRMKKGLGGAVRRELVRRVLRLADKALLLNLRWRRGEGVLRTVRWKRALADTAERRLLGLT